MDLIKCSSHEEEYQFYIVTTNGYLKALYIPFQVICLIEVDDLKLNTIVYVEAVSTHLKHIVIYRVLGRWYPFNQFKIKIQF